VLDLDGLECDRAVELLREARELQGSGRAGARRDLTLAEGCASLQRGDLILAEGELREAANRLVGDPRPHLWLGALEMGRDQPEEALGRFERALELDGGFVPATVGRADATAELGRFEDALEMLDRVAEPPRAQVEIRRGLVLEELERVDDARAAYRRAIELEPTLAEPYNNLAALERDAGNLDLAWQHQEAALERSPDDPMLIFNAGLLALATGRDEQGEEMVRRAAELDRSSPDPLRALADHFLVTGRATEAREILGDAVEEFPRDAALLNSLGNALAVTGRADEARAVYRRAIEADGDLAQPHNGLAALMLAAGDLEGAEVELVEAARLAPADPQVRRNLAELHRRRGEPERADRELRFAAAFR
jgi:Flp pilus assembly protein TadD